MKSPILSEDEASTSENLTWKSRTIFNSTLPRTCRCPGLPVPNTSPRLRHWVALFIIVVLAPPVSSSYVPPVSSSCDSRVLRLKGGRDVRHNMASSSPVVVPAKSSHSATVIWLHGLGDSGSGWAPIAHQLSLPHVKWIFPNAGSRPVTINGGTAMPVFIHDSFQCSF